MVTDDHAIREPFDRAAHTAPVTYREQVGSIFHVDHAEGPIPLRLATMSDEHVGGGFLQFSLFFHGPSSRLMAQGIYSFHHHTLGTLALFIVPILGSNDERIVYEACFNRRVATDEAQLSEGGNR